MRPPGSNSRHPETAPPLPSNMASRSTARHPGYEVMQYGQNRSPTSRQQHFASGQLPPVPSQGQQCNTTYCHLEQAAQNQVHDIHSSPGATASWCADGNDDEDMYGEAVECHDTEHAPPSPCFQRQSQSPALPPLPPAGGSELPPPPPPSSGVFDPLTDMPLPPPDLLDHSLPSSPMPALPGDQPLPPVPQGNVPNRSPRPSPGPARHVDPPLPAVPQQSASNVANRSLPAAPAPVPNTNQPLPPVPPANRRNRSHSSGIVPELQSDQPPLPALPQLPAVPRQNGPVPPLPGVPPQNGSMPSLPPSPTVSRPLSPLSTRPDLPSASGSATRMSYGNTLPQPVPSLEGSGSEEEMYGEAVEVANDSDVSSSASMYLIDRHTLERHSDSEGIYEDSLIAASPCAQRPRTVSAPVPGLAEMNIGGSSKEELKGRQIRRRKAQKKRRSHFGISSGDIYDDVGGMAMGRTQRAASTICSGNESPASLQSPKSRLSLGSGDDIDFFDDFLDLAHVPGSRKGPGNGQKRTTVTTPASTTAAPTAAGNSSSQGMYLPRCGSTSSSNSRTITTTNVTSKCDPPLLPPSSPSSRRGSACSVNGALPLLPPMETVAQAPADEQEDVYEDTTDLVRPATGPPLPQRPQSAAAAAPQPTQPEPPYKSHNGKTSVKAPAFMAPMGDNGDYLVDLATITKPPSPQKSFGRGLSKPNISSSPDSDHLEPRPSGHRFIEDDSGSEDDLFKQKPVKGRMIRRDKALHVRRFSNDAADNATGAAELDDDVYDDVLDIRKEIISQQQTPFHASDQVHTDFPPPPSCDDLPPPPADSFPFVPPDSDEFAEDIYDDAMTMPR